ncbi:septation protein SepH [Nocardioides ferulae]|uniref:septation protein SepH n=1 Tax=Nocardioides ferulae TaxID=2340821 RepID=UPI000EAEECDB|nr:septation protein SepH [Nocardioides ferulae]
MAHLTLTGVSDDGLRLRLVDDAGTEHTLDIDAGLRDAVRRARTGQQETQMDSSLRPRDIQARIRAGETPEAVADAAGTSVERIMPFAQPVLAEREHVAGRAQRSSVRRRAGEPTGPARTLGEAVTSQLRSHHADPGAVEWDAWRRDDGRWALTAGFAAGARSGIARFAFDVPGNYVMVENDDARWLVGDEVAEPAPARDDLQQVRRRRLAAVGDEQQLPLGDDALDLVRDEDQPGEAEVTADEPLEALLDEEPAGDEATERALRDEAADAAAEPEPAPRRTVRKRGGRASVPSWDEIMFGGGKPE